MHFSVKQPRFTMSATAAPAIVTSCDASYKKRHARNDPSSRYIKASCHLNVKDYDNYSIRFVVRQHKRSAASTEVAAVYAALERYLQLKILINTCREELGYALQEIKSPLRNAGFIYRDLGDVRFKILAEKFANEAADYDAFELSIIATLMQNFVGFKVISELRPVKRIFLHYFEDKLSMSQAMTLINKHRLLSKLTKARGGDPDYVLDQLINIRDVGELDIDTLTLKRYIVFYVLDKMKKNQVLKKAKRGLLLTVRKGEGNDYHKIIFDLTRCILKSRCGYHVIDDDLFDDGGFSDIYRVAARLTINDGFVGVSTHRDNLVKVTVKGRRLLETALTDIDREYHYSRYSGLRMKQPIYEPLVDEESINEDSILAYSLMRRMKGKNLRVLINECRAGIDELSEDVALNILRRIIAAYDKSTRQGKIIHRDMKPNNIIVRIRGSRVDVTIIDWNLARRKGKPDGREVGSYGFFAPEVVRGRIDRRSDIYSIGRVFQEVLSVVPQSPRCRVIDSLIDDMMAKKRAIRPGTDYILNVLEKLHADASVPSQAILPLLSLKPVMLRV